jgi:hypothetical protein
MLALNALEEAKKVPFEPAANLFRAAADQAHQPVV